VTTRILRENGLTLALLGLFALSILGQALAGWRSYNEERALHHEVAVSLRSYLVTGDFVSAVFENWDSEFLSVAVLAVLGIYLRERGSPESKPVAAPHSATGR
jgi:hypothetical protein